MTNFGGDATEWTDVMQSKGIHGSLKITRHDFIDLLTSFLVSLRG